MDAKAPVVALMVYIETASKSKVAT